MEDIKALMRHHYLLYATYVILDRAIPNLDDGLKPVQRRILYTLWQMHDGKLHKVANAAGQTMALHPHGDGPITDALVNLANKGYLLDRQGNFGNIYTGDPAAAARYIETRLSPLGIETLFNSDLMSYVPSYDGRNNEPVALPAKIPVLLLQGAEGIAVGMSTQILPHNFVELMEAEIAILEGRPFTLLPDFPTGGIMDASNYDKGRGKVKLRAKIEVVDPKTLLITQICYGTTTESLIRTIDDAAKKGKIKIDAINDYTAEKVEIEIKLPRNQYAEEVLESLYAFTDCEVQLSPQPVVIKEKMPCEMTVDEILTWHVDKLQGYIRRELEIEQARLLEKIFEKTLEQLFIENKIYKSIEEQSELEKIHEAIAKGLKPFHEMLSREPLYEDRERLLAIPIRRISRFDIEKNQKDIAACQKELKRIDSDLKNVVKVTINYIRRLLDKYGEEHARRTEIQELGQIDKRAIETRIVKVGFDAETGFVGTKVTSGSFFECTNFDKILLFFMDGTYKVINQMEKQYVHHDGTKVIYAGAADKKTVFSVVYQDMKTNLCYIKRFVVNKFMLDKVYHFIEDGMKLLYLTTQENATMEFQFIPKIKQKISKVQIPLKEYTERGVSAKGYKVSPRPVKKVLAVKADEVPQKLSVAGAEK